MLHEYVVSFKLIPRIGKTDQRGSGRWTNWGVVGIPLTIKASNVNFLCHLFLYYFCPTQMVGTLHKNIILLNIFKVNNRIWFSLGRKKGRQYST